MEKVMPVNYLTVENFQRYRKIMRFFYQRHRQMQGSLYRPEVIAMMQEEYLASYSELEVDQDLEFLVTWGNLQKQQEMVRPRSIEEYRNKNFRYQITEAGVLVEEMVYQLTHAKQVSRGALDEGGFRRLLELLKNLIAGVGDPVDVWLEIRQEFGKIREETANYIRYITSPEVDSRMKTEAFLVYKDKFVAYLRDFIISVQSLYFEFEQVIKHLPEVDADTLVAGLYQKEQEIPTLNGLTESEVQQQFFGECQALYTWFIADGDRSSEYDNLMEQTDQMISKITNLIYYFGQEIQQYQSRKKDYLQIAKWFAQADELADSQKMYAAIFGMTNSRHFYVTEGTEATSNREDSWKLAPGTLILKKRGRGARQERKASSFQMDLSKQIAERETYRARLALQREKINSYFTNGRLDFADVKELDTDSRKLFLRWISRAITTQIPDRQTTQQLKIQTIATELDFQVKVTIRPEERITVACEDGELTMPHVVMERIME